MCKGPEVRAGLACLGEQRVQEHQREEAGSLRGRLDGRGVRGSLEAGTLAWPSEMGAFGGFPVIMV